MGLPSFVLVCLTDTGNVRIDHHGIVGIVHYEAGLAATGLFYILLLQIVHFQLLLLTATGVVGRQSGSFFKGGIGWCFVSTLQDNM